MKRIIVWITVLTLIVTGVFAMNACGKRTDKDGISYQLNVSNFDGITTYGEPMDLSRIDRGTRRGFYGNLPRRYL